jgi:hypothetical protein
MNTFNNGWEFESAHEERYAEKIYRLRHHGRFYARTSDEKELLAIEADWRKAEIEKPAEIQAIKQEIGRARTYKPSFKQLCNILNYAKRTHFESGQIQSRTVDDLMLILIEESKDEALWIDLNLLTELDRDFIKDCQLTENRVIPLELIVEYLVANNHPLIYDTTTWSAIKKPDLNDDMPEPLRLALQERATAPQNLKQFELELADNIFLSQNCIPQIPPEAYINAGITGTVSKTTSYQPTQTQPTA